MVLEDVLWHIRDCRSCGHPIYLTSPIRVQRLYGGQPDFYFTKPTEFVRVGVLYGREVFIPKPLYQRYNKKNVQNTGR